MSDPHDSPRYETTDLSALLVAALGVLLLVGLLLVGAAVFRSFPSLPAARERSLVRAPGTPPPLPRLQTAAALDLAAVRQKETETLTTYGWIDRSQGTIHIPIERAMELTSLRGLPARPTP